MQHVIIVIHLMLVLALIGVVLLQRSEGGDLRIGSTGGFTTSRGTASVLTRATAILAGLFFVDQPAAVDPGWHQPQADISAARRAKRAPAAPVHRLRLGVAAAGCSISCKAGRLRPRRQLHSGPQVPQSQMKQKRRAGTPASLQRENPRVN